MELFDFEELNQQQELINNTYYAMLDGVTKIQNFVHFESYRFAALLVNSVIEDEKFNGSKLLQRLSKEITDGLQGSLPVEGIQTTLHFPDIEGNQADGIKHIVRLGTFSMYLLDELGIEPDTLGMLNLLERGGEFLHFVGYVASKDYDSSIHDKLSNTLIHYISKIWDEL